jgi:hypothetical protein
MSISTLDGALAGMRPPQPFAKAVTPTLVAGRPASLWYLGGAPGAGGAPANTAGGTVLSSTSAIVSGQIPHYDPGSGNSYLGQFGAMATQAGMLLLCDRLIQIAGNSGGSALSVTSTSAQTINSSTLPARDKTGTTNGDTVLFGLEVVAATGAGTPTITLGYTNQGGTAGSTATNIDAVVATSAIGAFYRLGLQAGDTGVQSVQSLTLSATMTSGTICLVGYRVLAELPLIGANIGNGVDALTSGFPQIFNGTVPFLILIPNTTTASNISGLYNETQG